MPGLQDNLIGVGCVCDNNCTVTFSNHAVNIYIPTGNPIITGWRETDVPCLWRMSLMPNPKDMHTLYSSPDAHKT